jgi:hypothetical protein
VIKCDGCNLKITDSELKVDIQILNEYLTGDKKNFKYDKSQLTTLDHERRHENHHGALWNAAASYINQHHNKNYKSENFCLLWASYFKESYSMFEYMAYLNDELFDCEEYGRCDRVEIAKKDVMGYASNLKMPDCDAK